MTMNAIKLVKLYRMINVSAYFYLKLYLHVYMAFLFVHFYFLIHHNYSLYCISFVDNTTIAGNHKVYCSNSTDSWVDGTVLYNAQYDNEDIDVFAVCKYIIYIPPILNGNTQMDICEIEIGGKYITVEVGKLSVIIIDMKLEN